MRYWIYMCCGVLIGNTMLTRVDVLSWETFSAVYWSGAAFLLCWLNERSRLGKEEGQ